MSKKRYKSNKKRLEAKNVTKVAKNYCGTKNVTKVAKHFYGSKNVIEVTKNVTQVAKNGFRTKNVTEVTKIVTEVTNWDRSNKKCSLMKIVLKMTKSLLYHYFIITCRISRPCLAFCNLAWSCKAIYMHL